MQYCSLMHSPYSNFIDCHNNVLYIIFSDLESNPGSYITSYLSSLFSLLKSRTNSTSVFPDHDVFEEYRPVSLWNVPELRSVGCFRIIGFRLCISGWSSTGEMRCPPSTVSAALKVCPGSAAVLFVPLVKVLSAMWEIV